MELFLHPWYMVAGGALISSPIIIHLINRMRFKRIRWAAMEFLLKSQKRNRRRLIIEQMILLLLRILLVLLIGFLVARYVGGALGSTGQGTMHVVIIDDTPSMGDHWVDQGNTRTAMDVARDQVRQLARTAAQGSSGQVLQVYRLSELMTRFLLTTDRLEMLRKDQVPEEVINKLRPLVDEGYDSKASFEEALGRAIARDQLKKYQSLILDAADRTEPLYDKRLDDRSEQDVSAKLGDVKVTALHVDPVRAIAKGRQILQGASQGQKILHFVSDFRESDWGTSDKLEELNEQINKLTGSGINLSLLDTAHPFRKDTKGIALNHDNLAIEDFKCDSRIAAEGMPVEFTLSIRNYSSKEITNCSLQVLVNGIVEHAAPEQIEKLIANGKTDIKFPLLFQKKQTGPEFVHLSARLMERRPQRSAGRQRPRPGHRAAQEGADPGDRRRGREEQARARQRLVRPGRAALH